MQPDSVAMHAVLQRKKFRGVPTPRSWPWWLGPNKYNKLRLKWEGLAWVRHSSTGEELDKFKCLEAKCREKPWKVRARTYGNKSPSRSEALRFIDSAKSPSTKINGSLVNFRRRLSNRHGRPRRMLTMDIRRTPTFGRPGQRTPNFCHLTWKNRQLWFPENKKCVL